ncbi:uncharacterized protein AB675_7599 [Cyphellophora attinorum]|uniref:NAD(P)-binding domain-containing protein n=1 Tax=Cyphellophora attinorum TaxID=1664694 RepID=A0A0N1P0R1_9EURO|nr:uncharacterized protein AB675_7599 [Phialophora attinorum]KPI40444.1 hypothetical protein AB675_7599 [Phialophora attinorum]
MTESNHIKNVALVGATGQVGSHILQRLLSSPSKFNITILTRKDSSAKIPTASNIKVCPVDYENHDELTTALTGVEVLIISLSVFTPKETQPALVDAAAAAKTVRYIIPNEWGTDWTDPVVNKTAMLGTGINETRDYIKSKGMSWISVVCGFWYEYSLGSGPNCYGFDFRSIPGKVYLYDGGNTPVNTSTWEHTGEGTVAMLELPIKSDSGLSIEGTFANSFLRLSSFQLSQRDMLAAVCRATSTSESEWEQITVSTEEYLKTGREQLQQGNRAGFGKILYGSVMEAYPDRNQGHAQAYQAHKGLHDEALGLAKEDLEACTKGALQIAKEKIETGQYWA